MHIVLFLCIKSHLEITFLTSLTFLSFSHCNIRKATLPFFYNICPWFPQKGPNQAPYCSFVVYFPGWMTPHRPLFCRCCNSAIVNIINSLLPFKTLLLPLFVVFHANDRFYQLFLIQVTLIGYFGHEFSILHYSNLNRINRSH